MGTKVAVAFANIFMAKIERKTEDRVLLNRWWRKDTLTMSSPCGTQSETKSKALFERSVKDFDSTIKFTSEISETTMNILGHESVQAREAILEVQNGTDLSIHDSCSCHPAGVTKEFLRVETLIRILSFVRDCEIITWRGREWLAKG